MTDKPIACAYHVMKTIVLLVYLALGVEEALSQSYSIVGHVIAGGGGVTGGGRFQIAGTLGQPEASPRLTGRCLSIDPGFWGDIAPMATPGLPTLYAHRIDLNYIRVSFTPGCHEWVLQWTRVLENDPGATVWTDDAASNLVAMGDDLTREFHVPSWGPRLFFRLRQQ